MVRLAFTTIRQDVIGPKFAQSELLLTQPVSVRLTRTISRKNCSIFQVGTSIDWLQLRENPVNYMGITDALVNRIWVKRRSVYVEVGGGWLVVSVGVRSGCWDVDVSVGDVGVMLDWCGNTFDSTDFELYRSLFVVFGE